MSFITEAQTIFVLNSLFKDACIGWMVETVSPQSTGQLCFPSNMRKTGLPWWLSGKEPVCPCWRHMFDPQVRKIPWRREWQSTPVFLSGKSYGQRSLVEIVHGFAKDWATKQLHEEGDIFQDKGLQVCLKPFNRRGFLNPHFSAGLYCPLHMQYPSGSACMLPGGLGNMRVWHKTHAACCAVIKTFVPDPGVSCPLTLRELVVGHIPGCEQDRVSDCSQCSSLGNRWMGAGIPWWPIGKIRYPMQGMRVCWGTKIPHAGSAAKREQNFKKDSWQTWLSEEKGWS